MLFCPWQIESFSPFAGIMVRMSAMFIITVNSAYVAQAMAELRAVDPEIRDLRPLSPGVIRFTAPLGRDRFLEALAARPPIFVRHIHPVDLEMELAAHESDLERVATHLPSTLSRLRPGERVAVQVRRLAGQFPYTRHALKAAIDRLVAEAGGVPVVAEADQILSVAKAGQQAHVGLSAPPENLSDWPGGEIRFRKEEEQVSRAKFKLLEAFASFSVALPTGGEALDLGAAPGGWTSLLLERGMRVTAVDTGELAPSLRHHPRLTFCRAKVEAVRFPPGRFGLITCDMSWNPLYTADLLVRHAESVKSGAHGILTVKLMLGNPTRTIRRVADLLAPAYQVERVRQLFHNRDEVTMHLVRR